MTDAPVDSELSAPKSGVHTTDYTLGSDTMVWWTTPILRRQCDPEGRICEALKALVLEKAASGEATEKDSEGGWHSDDDVLNWKGSEISQLEAWFVQASQDMAQAISGSQVYQSRVGIQARANLCRHGQYIPVQSNPSSMWSGLYYVEAGDVPTPEHPQSGVIEFFDPRAGAEMIALPGHPFGKSKFYAPKTGELFMFPSWLKYMVHPYWGGGDRISIAFTVRLRPTVRRRRR